MKQQHTLQPKLRFPEFEGDWEKTKLGNISKKPKYGLNSSATEYDGINGYLRITDIDESSNKFIKDKLTSPDSFSDEFLLKERDLIFTRTGASTGKSYLYTKEDGKLYFAGFLIKFSLKDICNDKFVFYQTKLVRYSKWVKIMSMRSGQPGINSEEYSTLDIILPSLPEQQKIADYLTTIDKKIELLEEKKTELSRYKKAMMQKLFAQEIRFKDENGNDYPEWEENKLKELSFKMQSGGTPTASNRDYYDTGKIPFLSISDMTEQGKYLTKTKKFINQLGLDNSSSWLVPKNSIIYSMYASVGFVSINKIDVSTSQAVMNIILKDEYNLEYVYYYLNYFQKYIFRYIETGTQGNVNAEIVKNIKIPIPIKLEQQKIADFLSAIDESITKVEEQIKETQNFKKAMLQQLFV